jgi:hypothetical protein
MSLVARFNDKLMPDGAMQLALGANRVCRQAELKRYREVEGSPYVGKPIRYELRMTFTIPEDRVLDVKSIELHEL